VTPDAALRASAESLAAPLPPLLARAEHLAATVVLGDHGRRRAGLGDTFWQYRPALPTDDARRIDWRRSARSDASFVQDKEWQIAQSVSFWVDGAAAMRFSSDTALATKADRARLLALATAILLLRGGERVGLLGADIPPRRGLAQAARLAQHLVTDDPADFGVPDARGLGAQSRAVLISDFFGDMAEVEQTLARASDRSVDGVLLQVIDPQEETFPFRGRTLFESVGGSLHHETQKAGGLRDRYIAKLAERRDRLTMLARESGWSFGIHRTSDSATAGLMWVFETLEGRR